MEGRGKADPLRAVRLNGNQLKLIAVISMLLDHIGYLLVGKGMILSGEADPSWWTAYYALRMIGRVAFPIFAFFVLEGFLHTRDWRRYAIRLGVFAVLSEIPFDLFNADALINWEMQNVFFTLFLGLLMMKTLEATEVRLIARSGKSGGRLEWMLLAQLAIIGVFCGVAWLMKTDYDYIGIMLIALFYWFRQDRLQLSVMGFVWMSAMGRRLYFLPGFAMAFLMIYAYNGQRGKQNWKYFFYLFYPIHLLLLAGVYRMIF